MRIKPLRCNSGVCETFCTLRSYMHTRMNVCQLNYEIVSAMRNAFCKQKGASTHVK